MKKVISLFSAVAAAAVMSMTAMAEDLLPKVIWNSYKAFGNEAINICGADFDKLTEVKIQTVTGESEIDISKADSNLEILSNSEDIIQGVIPASVPNGLYAMWIVTENGTSKTIYVNNPEIVTISQTYAVPGQTVNIAGRNLLNPATGNMDNVKVVLVSKDGRERYEAKVTMASEYAADFIVPEGIKYNQEYTVMYSNGVGDESVMAVNDPIDTRFTVKKRTKAFDVIKEKFGIEAFWFSEINTDNEYNAKDFNIPSDGKTSCDEAIMAMFEKIDADGGGLVYFPEGTYLIGHIDVPANVILYGAGGDKTVFTYDNSQQPWEAQKKHEFVWGESLNMITMAEEHCALIDVGVVSTHYRPESDWRWRIGGWVQGVHLGTPYKKYVTGGSIREYNGGYYLKNVCIKILDGSGVDAAAADELVIDSCNIRSTGSSVNLTGNCRPKVINSYLYNETSPTILTHSNFAWVEGNTLDGYQSGWRMLDERNGLLPEGEKAVEQEKNYLDIATYKGERPMIKIWGASEHRYFDMWERRNYVANNKVIGKYGTVHPLSRNDGEGFLTQWTASNKGGRGKNFITSVTAADKTTLEFVPVQNVGNDKYKNWRVLIVAGRGAGQMREITSSTADGKITIKGEWDVIPDETSNIMVDWFIGYKNIWVHNDCSAYTKKAAFMIFTNGVDYTISNNITTDSSGITISQSTVGDGDLYGSHFITISDNIITSSDVNDFNGYRRSLGIGKGNDGNAVGVQTVMKSTNIRCYSSMFNEIRNNKIALGKKYPDEPISKWDQKYYQYSGIIVGPIGTDDLPETKGYIVEGNEVVNTLNGIFIGSAGNTLIRKNNLVNNDYKYRQNVGIETIIDESGFNPEELAINAGIDQNVYYAEN